MAYQTNLLGDIFRRQSQRKALTGLPSSYQETRGLFDAALEYDAQKAKDAGLLELQNRRLNQQQSQFDKQLDVAKQGQIMGGVGQLAQLPIAYGAAKGAGLLGGTTAQGAVAPAVAGVPAQTAAIGVPAQSAAFTGATGTAGYGAAEGSGAAGVLGAEGAGGMGLLGGAGLAAGAYGAQLATSPYVDKYVGDKMDMPYTAKAWKYGGAVGALAVAPVELAAKAIGGAKDFLSKVF